MPVPRRSFQWQCPLTSDPQPPHTSFLTHPTHLHTRLTQEPPFFSPALPSSFPLFLIFLPLDFSPLIEYPTHGRRTHDITDIIMRRALAIGLALYLGLGRVLSSPVQVQVPFELNKENIAQVEDVPAPASKFFLSFFSTVFHRGGSVGERATEIERTLANPYCCDLGPPRQLQGRFLHITDLHPDPLYRVGGAASTACHRNKPKKEKLRAGFLGTPYFEFVILFLPSFLLLFPGSFSRRKLLDLPREDGH